jgi:hypothetical protein
VWTIIATKAEARLRLNQWAGRIVLGAGVAAIFLFYGWVYNAAK